MTANGRRAAAAVAILAVVSIVSAAVEEIDHFVRVDRRVCTGGQPTPEQVAELGADGVRTVIDLREPAEHDLAAEAKEVRRLGLRFVNIPVAPASPRAEQADAFLAATVDPGVFPIFVHCASGNRVGAFWMIRRVLVDGWALERAEAEARHIGLKSENLTSFARDYIRVHKEGR